MPSQHEYVNRLRQQLEDWDYQLDRLEHRVQDLGNDARDRAKQKLADVRRYRADVEARLKKLESAAGDALEDVRDGLEIAWDGLKTGFLAARSEFEEEHKEKQD